MLEEVFSDADKIVCLDEMEGTAPPKAAQFLFSRLRK